MRISNKHDASYYTVTNYGKEEKTSRTSGLLILFIVGHGGGIEELERCPGPSSMTTTDLGSTGRSALAS